MKYLVSEVENWGKEIDAIPAPDPGRRKVGKKEAVFLLARKLQAAARRGVSTAELLNVLASKGLTVHVDTVRAALRVGGRGAVTSPVRSRRIAGDPKGLRKGNGVASDTASGRPNARGSVGDRPERGAEVGSELGPTLGRGGGGEVAAAKVERDTTAARRDAGGSEGDDPEQRADVDPATGPIEARQDAGDRPASRAGSGTSELGNGRRALAESGGVELARSEPQGIVAARGSPGVESGRRDRPSSVDVPGKHVGEAGGRGASPPAGVGLGGGEASGSTGPERRPAALTPVRGSFIPRKDSEEI